MLTASQLLDQLGAKLMDGLPAPAGGWIRVTECPGKEPNWIAEVSMSLPLAIAERWTGVLAGLQWNAPRIDFSDATETYDGERSVISGIGATGASPSQDRARTPAISGDPDRRELKSVLGWVAGIPLALALAVAAFIAMAE